MLGHAAKEVFATVTSRSPRAGTKRAMQHVTNDTREPFIRESPSFFWLSSASVWPPSRKFSKGWSRVSNIRVKTVWNLEKASVEKFRPIWGVPFIGDRPPLERWRCMTATSFGSQSDIYQTCISGNSVHCDDRLTKVHRIEQCHCFGSNLPCVLHQRTVSLIFFAC